MQANNAFNAVTSLLDQLPIGAYAVNENSAFVYVNPVFAEMVGRLPDDMVDGTVPLAQFVFGNAEQLGFGASWHGELAFKNRHNKPIKSFVNQVLLPLGGGQAGLRYGFVVTGEAHTGAEKKPDGSSNPLYAFIDAAPLAIAIMDETGYVQHSNLAMRRLTGKPDEEKSGWSLVQTLKQESKNDVHGLIKSAKEAGYDPLRRLVEVEIPHPQRREVSASLYVGAHYKVNLEEARFIAMLVDTTEFKNLELRMVHSQKMQAVGQLAGGIAHDFNNLLTAMMGFCDLLLIRHPAGDPSFADIMQVKQNANRAANLVRQLLAFSRKQTLQPEVIDVTDILAELSNLLRRLIGENIELKITHGRDLGPVKVDQGQFEQVVINLAVNARDAMKSGGTLTIRTTNVMVDRKNPISPDLIPPAEDEEITDGEYVLIEVTDTGHGIDADIIGKIFEPFFSTKEIGSGTGLGLATVYGIIKQTGGYIYVSSRVNQGTTFSIFLPKASEGEMVKQKEAQDKEEKIASDLTGAGTILLVEDEDPVRIFSARALRNKGYHVLEADCGEAALLMMEERGTEIDLVVTDVVMPGINGPTMVEEILRKYKEISVIFISGYGEDAFFKTYGTERKFNFLPKPFTLKQLAVKVKEVMDQRKRDKGEKSLNNA
jgi:two-component system cell cycle sensor histidine kinase/response regulator CckA